MKRGEAIVWLPPRKDGERALGSEAHLLALRGGESSGAAPLARVSLDGLEGTSQVRLVFDARDVTLLSPEVPALSGSRLAQALPNVIEESLLQDVSTCAIVAGPDLGEGRRLLAVIDREWLESTVSAFERRGMRVRAAWPGQLTMPLEPGCWSLTCLRDAVALQTGPNGGMGWSVGEDPDFRAEAIAGLLETALAVGERPQGLSAWVDDPAWMPVLQTAAAQLGLPIQVHAMGEPMAASVDLLGGRATASRRMIDAFDVRAWRLPMALAGATLAAALVGLNLHWAQLANEKAAIRRSLEASFRSAFPSAQVVVDPLLQMNRQVASLRTQGGQSGPDDMAPLVARLGTALGANGQDALAGLEYREGRLKVRFKPERVDGRAAREQLREACAAAGLTLQFDSDREPTATVGLQG